MAEQSAAAPTTSSTAAPKPAEDWPAQAADTVVNLVDQVRDKTTGPVLTAARGLVYGTFAFMLVSVVVVCLCVVLIRVLTNYLPGHHVWVSYYIVGGAVVGIALYLWSKANAPGDS